MGKLKLEEAIVFAKRSQKIVKSDMAREIWKNSTLGAARANLSNLIHGRSRSIDIEAVGLICERLGVSADFLFGLTEFPNGEEKKRIAQDIISRLDGAKTDLELLTKTF